MCVRKRPLNKKGKYILILFLKNFPLCTLFFQMYISAFINTSLLYFLRIDNYFFIAHPVISGLCPWHYYHYFSNQTVCPNLICLFHIKSGGCNNISRLHSRNMFHPGCCCCSFLIRPWLFTFIINMAMVAFRLFTRAVFYNFLDIFWQHTANSHILSPNLTVLITFF